MARGQSEDDRLEPDIERLYALPPAAFTAARQELAVRLRRAGRRDAAATVKALPRPTPSSWAVSRLMRLEPTRFRALLAAGRQARQAQERVLRRGGAPAAAAAAELREALAAARLALEELRRRGLELLAAGGKPATAMVADRLAADLQALAFTAGDESAIARGWLDHDLEAPGFEVLAGLQAAAGRAGASSPPPAQAPPAARPRRLEPRPSPSTPQPPPGRPSAAQSRQEAADARRRQVETQRRAEQAEQARREQARRDQARERGRALLAAAQADVERAERGSAELTAAAVAAERAAADARRRAEEAQREAERARRGAERASQQLERARERLAAARAAADRLMFSGAVRRRGDETR
jgi:hypothetical protein